MASGSLEKRVVEWAKKEYPGGEVKMRVPLPGAVPERSYKADVLVLRKGFLRLPIRTGPLGGSAVWIECDKGKGPIKAEHIMSFVQRFREVSVGTLAEGGSIRIGALVYAASTPFDESALQRARENDVKCVRFGPDGAEELT